MKLIAAVETLPKAVDGSKNAFENFADTVGEVVAQVGDALNRVLFPELKKVAEFVQKMSDKGQFAKMADNMMASFSKGGETESAIQSGGIRGVMVAIPQMLGADSVLGFLTKSDGFGDLLTRGAAIFKATMERLPQIWDLSSRPEFPQGLVDSPTLHTNQATRRTRTSRLALPQLFGQGAPQETPKTTSLCCT